MNIVNRFGSSVRALIAASILSPPLLYGQLGQTATSSVTVTATGTTTIQPSEAVFLVTVNSPFSTSLSDAAASVSSIGITPSDLLTVRSASLPSPTAPTQPSSSLAWTFQLITPFSNQKATATALAALQNTIGQNNSGLSLSFSVSSYGESAASCGLSSLVASARSQAQTLATAAGQGLGGIIGITSGVSNPGPSPCSMTVKFALGYQYWESAPSITINASQAASPQHDQAIVSLAVTSGLATALDDVTGALLTAGISGATLAAVETVPTYTGSAR